MGRFDLTDIEGAAIQASRPTKVRGAKRVDDRQVLHGIFWWLGIRAPWADIPARYGAAHDLREQVQSLAQDGP